jgi:type I restriction enzyme S subunit
VKADLVDTPEGWMCARLGDVLQVSYGKGLKESNRRPGTVPVYGSNGVVGFHDTPLINGPAIVVGRKGTVGAVHLSNGPCWPIDTTYFINDFATLDPQFVLHVLRSMGLAGLDTSSAIPGLNRDQLYDQPLLMPPLAEQKRIVAKVEELLARVNAARERLTRAPAILKRFRQSVLAAACSGRLTADWRKNHPNSCSALPLLHDLLASRAAGSNGSRTEAMAAEGSENEDVPNGWVLASMDQLTSLVTSGSRGWAKYYTDSGPLFIRAQDINTDELRLDNVAHVKPPKGAEGARTRVRCGDLLITITGANVTKSAAVKIEIGEAYVSQHVALARPVVPDIAAFLHLWTISPLHGRAKLLSDAYGAGKPGLNLDNVREMPIALPSCEEQKEIVQRVNALFAIADNTEMRLGSGNGRAEKLTQAILAKAFRGELVPTDADLARAESCTCEPASAVLGRFQREDVASE